jgi:hypothetical protein
MPRWSVFRNQPAQQRLGAPDDQLTVVGDHDVVAALVVGPVVAETGVTGMPWPREPVSAARVARNSYRLRVAEVNWPAS